MYILNEECKYKLDEEIYLDRLDRAKLMKDIANRGLDLKLATIFKNSGVKIKEMENGDYYLILSPKDYYLFDKVSLRVIDKVLSVVLDNLEGIALNDDHYIEVYFKDYLNELLYNKYVEHF